MGKGNEREYKIYKLTSPEGKVYIGASINPKRRWKSGKGYTGCRRMNAAIERFGWDNFEKEIILEGLTKEESELKEVEYIKLYKSNDVDYGYNIDGGAHGLGGFSEETRALISKANKGKNNHFYGKHQPLEIRQAHSEFMRGNDYFKGKHHSEEYKKTKSEQMKKKYANGGNPKCKSVICESLDGNIVKEFFSLREAAKEMNISPSTMLNIIRKSKEKGGMKWRYADE